VELCEEHAGRPLSHLLAGARLHEYCGNRDPRLRGQGRVAWRAKLDAIHGLRRMLAKRRSIQPTRKISVRDLLAQMGRGWPRPKGRLFHFG
jgi:hypothetical protein